MYKINDIFYADESYSDRAGFCNQNNLMIVEIEPDKKGRRFQIQEIPAPTQKELNQQKIQELKQKLEETDYQAIKFAEGQINGDDYASIREQRQQWRNEINELEK